MQNPNKALKETLEKCIVDKCGLWIDTYNQTVSDGIAGTICSGIDRSRHIFVSVRKHEDSAIKIRSAN